MEHLRIMRWQQEITSTKSFHSVVSEEEVAVNDHHAHLIWHQWISFFGSVVKNKVYEKNLKTVNELKDYSHDTFRETDEDRKD